MWSIARCTGVRSAHPDALRETDRPRALDAIGTDRERSVQVNTAEKLVSEFDPMVRRDGGVVSRLGDSAGRSQFCFGGTNSLTKPVNRP